MSFLSSDESKRRVFEFWTVGWTKGAFFSQSLTFYSLNESSNKSNNRENNQQISQCCGTLKKTVRSLFRREE